jgi:hypothetical protein
MVFEFWCSCIEFQHAPAFIFPLSQQQPAAASVQSGSGKPSAAGSAASSSTSNSAAVSASATAAAAAVAPAMSFNFPNMPGSETQYLAILQNNAYQFPIPAHVGTPPTYRGTHGQAMPFLNPFYPSQMLHPSQIHQQQQPPAQSQQSHQGHQNASISSGSSSSQKHLQNLQHRQHGNGVNVSSGNLQGFPAPKNQPSQPLQQQQQQQNQQAPHQARQLESETGGEDSPSTADSRVSRANMSLYGPNFVPIHPPNFAVMTAASMGAASGTTSTSGSHNEKKQQQQPQQQGLKAGVEPQAFAMSFASMNGATTAPCFDLSSFPPNHPIFQSPPELQARQLHYLSVMAQAAGKRGGASSNVEERKAMPGKALSTVGQSIAFSRPDLTDTSVTTLTGNTVVDSSARTLNLGSAMSSGPVLSNSEIARCSAAALSKYRHQQQQQHQQQLATNKRISAVVAAAGQQQQQQPPLMSNSQKQQLATAVAQKERIAAEQQQQQQQMNMFQKQQIAAGRSKTPATSNGSVYLEHHPSSSSMSTKFTNALSSFPQNLVQSSCSPAQSQWKNSVQTTTSQGPSPSLSSSTSSSLKNLPQQQGRTQQSHTQISFAANLKSSTAQGQQPPSSSQSPSPPIMVGSPTTSMSKSAGGSPKTTASISTANKAGQVSTLSSQQAKNSPSVPSRKSSPVGGRNVSSILGNNPHINSSSSTATKPQLQQQQQQQQQQLSKQMMNHPQLFYNTIFVQPPGAAQSASTTSSASAANAYYPQNSQRNRREQQQQQPQGSSGTSSTGMLSLCPPVTHSNTSTSDPAKVVAAATATSNMKGGLPSQSILHVTQFGVAQSSGNLVPAGFPYVHAVPTSVQMKPAEQKQPAGE